MLIKCYGDNVKSAMDHQIKIDAVNWIVNCLFSVNLDIMVIMTFFSFIFVQTTNYII